MDFWPQFSQGIERAAEKAGKKDFFMFGEVYSADPEISSSYVRQGGLPATLDFAFQEAARGYTAGAGSAKALADVYARDDLYAGRDTDAGRLTTFLGNHDMGRIGSFIAGGGSDPASHLRRDQLAHQLMFLTRGQPVVYSGDEQGFTGPGGDKDARQDMFASKVPDYLDDDLLGTDRTHASDQFDTEPPAVPDDRRPGPAAPGAPGAARRRAGHPVRRRRARRLRRLPDRPGRPHRVRGGGEQRRHRADCHRGHLVGRRHLHRHLRRLRPADRPARDGKLDPDRAAAVGGGVPGRHARRAAAAAAPTHHHHQPGCRTRRSPPGPRSPPR